MFIDLSLLNSLFSLIFLLEVFSIWIWDTKYLTSFSNDISDKNSIKIRILFLLIPRE